MKSKVYAVLGTFFITAGALYINFGLGLMVLGAVFILKSYLEFDERGDGNQET
jgi:hypothetical protein